MNRPTKMHENFDSNNSPLLDLSEYKTKILSPEDYPLFEDAISAAKAGAFRAAYVMIWLSCAESLKRRFRESQRRDTVAGKIVGSIEKKEREHKAVDKFLLAKAFEYGFINDSANTILNHVYEMRCLYGHPYEEAPSKEQVSHAACVVVEHILSKPVTLRHGFGQQLLKSLLEDRSYLDDQQSAVVAFSKDILPRIDENIYCWFLDKYLKELENIADDSSLDIFFRRGKWFCNTMLIEIGVGIYSDEDWHNRVGKFPKILMRVCSNSNVFREIGRRAQDSFVGLILSESKVHPSLLTLLECLMNENILNKRQSERFFKHIAELPINTLRSACLSTKTCYKKLIDAMKSHNWYVQSPAIELIVSNGHKQAQDLNVTQQITLGRNILQCADGTERQACQFLKKISECRTNWPFNVVLGIGLEVFINEKNGIRFKTRHLNLVLSALEHLKPSIKTKHITKIANAASKGTPENWIDEDDFKDVISKLKKYNWSQPLTTALSKKLDEIVTKVSKNAF